MTKPVKKFKPAQWINFAISDIKIYPKTQPQLEYGEAKVWKNYCAFVEKEGRFPTTADVAKLGTDDPKKAAKTWTARKLNQLVCYGYLCSYLKGSKRKWCSFEEAERLQKAINDYSAKNN